MAFEETKASLKSFEFCISIVFSYSRDFQWSQEKTKTVLMQNLEGQTKSIMVFSKVAHYGHQFKLHIAAGAVILQEGTDRVDHPFVILHHHHS